VRASAWADIKEFHPGKFTSLLERSAKKSMATASKLSSPKTKDSVLADAIESRNNIFASQIPVLFQTYRYANVAIMPRY
jgi:hypothetical protein